MCTAVTFHHKDFYFGRTLDLERTYGEEVVISQRNFPFSFRENNEGNARYAIIGMAHISNGYPLYYDAVNEAGLCMAGLNFPGFAQYQEPEEGKENVACFEFIPWVLAGCASVTEVCEKMINMRLTATAFNSEFPVTELHWIIADRRECVTVEFLDGCMKIHKNPVGVLTNSPPLEDQMFFLRNFMHLSANPPQNLFSSRIDLKPYSQGMGAIGMPGDQSSLSRFVRAVFTKLNSVCEDGEEISQFFHIMDTVSQVRGCSRLVDGSSEITQYTSCCNASKGVYYYTTYGNRRICAVDLHGVNLTGDGLFSFPLAVTEDVCFLNRA